MSKNKLVYVLGFAPLLLGADPAVDSVQSALTVTTALPKCGPNEYLSYQGAGLICRSFESGSVKVVDCNSMNQVLTYKSGGEFADFTCAAKGGASIGQTEITQITNLTTISTQIRNTLNDITTNPPASAPVYVGVTTTTTKGRITSGTKVGLSAAAEVCAAQFPGSRMCTVYEMFNSVTKGIIKDTDTINKAWVYQASWNNPAGARPTGTDDEEGDAGMNDNCGSYTYPTGDQKWVGTAVAWQNIIYNGNRGLKFYSGSAQAPCSTALPIACCK